MKFTDIQAELQRIIQNQNGNFISAYQVCNQMETLFPQQWARLRDAYPSQEGYPEMGAGANKPYSPATFVAQALEHFRKNGAPLRKEYFICENVNFNGIKPGFTGNLVSIWAWQS